MSVRPDLGPRPPDEIDGQPPFCVAPQWLWDRSDRFLATVQSGETADAWRARRRLELANLFALPPDPVSPLQVTELDAYRVQDSVQVRVLEVGSLFDGAPIQVLHVSPLERDPQVDPPVVFTLHGHGNQLTSTLDPERDLRGLGLELALRGAEVFSPSYRGDASHAAYTQDLEDGVFVQTTLADLTTFVALAHQLVAQRASTSVMGHSLGGYLSLHLAALRTDVDAAYVSGLFVPLECMNSEAHHRCQNFGPVGEAFGTDDLAALVSPRRLGIYFGDRDIFYTPATEAVIDRALQVYELQGQAERLQVQVDPGVPHRVVVERVLEFLGADTWPEPGMDPD